jgi:hypothetical protein
MLPAILHTSFLVYPFFSLTFVNLINPNSLATVPTSQRLELLLINNTQTQKMKSVSQSCMGSVAAS